MPRLKYYNKQTNCWDPIPSSSSGSVSIDTTLTQAGQAADAKAVGDAINQISSNGSDFLLVTVTADNYSTNLVGDKTYEEIAAAYNADKIVHMVYFGNEYSITSLRAHVFHFYPVVMKGLTFQSFYVTSDNVWGYEEITLKSNESDSGGNVDQETITVKKPVEFDSIEENKVYNGSFPTGATLNGYNTYNKAVTPGEVYYITSMPVENNGYGIAHFFNGNTFVSVVGPYPDVSEKQTDYKVTVPAGVNLMRIIPGAGYGEPVAAPVVWHWSNGEPVADSQGNTNTNYTNYVEFDGSICTIKAKYNDTEDVCFEISPGGGNNLPDIRRIFTVNNSNALNDSLSVNRTLLYSQTDLFSPHVVCAVANADGDTPANAYFTGGNHQTNNGGSGGAVTARSEGITVKCDGKTVDGGTYGNYVVVSWVNYIQGYNTSNAEGTGREIMKEEITLTITGTKIEVDVRHYALEDIIRKTYYGLQMVCGAYAGARYIGGSNRVENSVGSVTNSGDKKCRAISLFTEDGDLMEIGIHGIDLGSFEYSTRGYSAFMEATGKSYFSVIQNAEFEQQSGEMTTLRGYYHIMHK